MKSIRPPHFLLGLAAFAAASLWAQTEPSADTSAPPAAYASALPSDPTPTPSAPAGASPKATPTPDDPENSSEKLSDLSPTSTQPLSESAEVTERKEQPERIGKPAPRERRERWERAGNGRGNEVATFGDAYLEEGKSGDVVVAILGNATAHGPVHGPVVAILGDSTATENVGEAVVAVLGNAHAEKDVGEDVVAVLGSVRANGRVHGNVVSILGTITLGPNARIEGEVVSVGGVINRHPSSVVIGNTTQLAFLKHVPLLGTLGLWFRQAIGHGRLVAFHSELGGAWGIAGAFFVLYLLLALAFGKTITRCAESLEQRPGVTVLTAFLSFMLAPILFIPLAFTVVGALAFLVAIIVALLVGKAAFLGWIGRRLGGQAARSNIALAVLIGGIVVLLLYSVPVLALLLWAGGSALGFGMAVSTLLQSMRKERPAPLPAIPAPPTAGPAAASAPPAAPTGQVTSPVAPAPGPVSPQPVASATPASSSIVNGAPEGANRMTEPPVPPAIPITPPPARSTSLPPPLISPVSAIGLPRAGFWPRLAASALDAVLIALLSKVVHLTDYFLLFLTTYCLVMWALRGTTVGGIICGLKIVRLDERPLDWTIAIVRVLGAFLSACVAGLGFIWVAFDPEMQSWHDKVAGTTIVRVPKGTSLV